MYLSEFSSAVIYVDRSPVGEREPLPLFYEYTRPNPVAQRLSRYDSWLRGCLLIGTPGPVFLLLWDQFARSSQRYPPPPIRLMREWFWPVFSGGDFAPGEGVAHNVLRMLLMLESITERIPSLPALVVSQTLCGFCDGIRLFFLVPCPPGLAHISACLAGTGVLCAPLHVLASVDMAWLASFVLLKASMLCLLSEGVDLWQANLKRQTCTLDTMSGPHCVLPWQTLDRSSSCQM